MQPSDHQAQVHAAEAQFHDEWARSVPLEKISVREAFEAPTAMENRFILSQMGPLTGKTLLDVGAGLGESSVYFALQGATVTLTDISQGMVDTAIRLGQLHGVTLNGFVSIGEKIDAPSAAYDIVYIANTIHHVTDKEKLFAELARVLKP